jgi:hypothetical protein
MVWNSVSNYLPIFGFRGLFNSSLPLRLKGSKIPPKSALPSICQIIFRPHGTHDFRRLPNGAVLHFSEEEVC